MERHTRGFSYYRLSATQSPLRGGPFCQLARQLTCVVSPFLCFLPHNRHSFFFLLFNPLDLRAYSMSGPAPGTRLKTKTSGLSDFFGAHNQHTNATRPSPKKLPATPSRISPPQNTQQAELSSSTKSKKSSIPFWGKRKSGGAAPSPSPSKRKPTPASPPPPVPRLSGSSGTRTNNG
jgi:hypothetical protein